jgi:hypothetical protein
VGGDTTRFLIDNTTAEVWTTSNPRLNFEAQPTYTLIVNAIDPGGLSTNVTVVVNLNDINEPPVFLSENASVYELTVGRNPLLDTTVGVVTARDYENDVQYQIVWQNVTGMFAVDGTSGLLTVAAYHVQLEQPNVYIVTLMAIEVRPPVPPPPA